MRKSFFITCLLMYISFFIQAQTIHHTSHHHQKLLPGKVPDTAFICASIDQLSDIDFEKQEFRIQFWLGISYNKKDSFCFEKQIQIIGSKDKPKIDKIYVGSSKNGIDTIELRINCIMSHYWNVNYFPFDKQKISIPIYNFVFNSDDLVFKWDKDSIYLPENSELEGGWKLNKTADVNFPLHETAKATIDDHSHSVFRINFELRRSGKVLLFLNLFIGMYIAFFVSYIAFFIGLKYNEPRFALPVGGLFAAIANKYVVQDLLPKAPGFTLVDFLHLFTVTWILLIILSSAIRLSERDKLEKNKSEEENIDLHESKMAEWVKRFTLNFVTPKMIFRFYIIVNIIMIVFGILLDAFGLS